MGTARGVVRGEGYGVVSRRYSLAVDACGIAVEAAGLEDVRLVWTAPVDWWGEDWWGGLVAWDCRGLAFDVNERAFSAVEELG